MCPLVSLLVYPGIGLFKLRRFSVVSAECSIYMYSMVCERLFTGSFSMTV